MKLEDLDKIEEGDEIEFTTIRLTPDGVKNGPNEKALVIGKTSQSALIKRGRSTIAVQAHNIVAVRRDGQIMPQLPISQGTIKTSLREMFQRCGEEISREELNYLVAREDILSLNVRQMREILQQRREQANGPTTATH